MAEKPPFLRPAQGIPPANPLSAEAQCRLLWIVEDRLDFWFGGDGTGISQCDAHKARLVASDILAALAKGG